MWATCTWTLEVSGLALGLRNFQDVGKCTWALGLENFLAPLGLFKAGKGAGDLELFWDSLGHRNIPEQPKYFGLRELNLDQSHQRASILRPGQVDTRVGGEIEPFILGDRDEVMQYVQGPTGSAGLHKMRMGRIL